MSYSLNSLKQVIYIHIYIYIYISLSLSLCLPLKFKRGSRGLYRVLGLGLVLPPKMDNQTEKNMEREMDTGIMGEFIGD